MYATDADDRRWSSGLYATLKKPTPCLSEPVLVISSLKLGSTGMFMASLQASTQSLQSALRWRAWTGWTVLRSLFMRRMKSLNSQPFAPRDSQIFRSYSKGRKEMSVLCEEQPPRTLARECRMCELPIRGENTDEPQDSLFLDSRARRDHDRAKVFSRQLLPLSSYCLFFLVFHLPIGCSVVG